MGKMRGIATLILLFSLGSYGIASGAYSWYDYGGHQYALTSTAKNWSDAEAEAVSQGGHLVTINDGAEQAFLEQTFFKAFSVWIGFYQDGDDPGYSEPAGGWKWISGEPVAYTNWDLDSDEPNNLTGEDHAVMNFLGGADGKWHDRPGSATRKGIIETVVPIPGTAWLLGSGLLGLVGFRKKFKK